ncbi:MAG: type IV secretory system conjugative DNA transfer family protein [Bacteroidetes bacterium]|nr:type IV secretory system conjugative DNA transfer family protein [Bacteroidota bacterium]
MIQGSELFNYTSQTKISQGYKVYILNFGNPTVSAGYNPLFYAKNINDINKIANALVRGSVKTTSDDFWNIQAVSIISIMISILKTQPTEYVNLFNVRHLISILGSEPIRLINYSQNMQVQYYSLNTRI